MCLPRRVQVRKIWRQYKHVCLLSKLVFLGNTDCFLFSFSGLFCEFSPPMVLPRTSPCDNYECQNGAQCIIKETEPICQCLSGYQGEKCEKLISINFVNKESYLQIPSAKIRPQTNITLQVSLLVLWILFSGKESKWLFMMWKMTKSCHCLTWRAFHSLS